MSSAPLRLVFCGTPEFAVPSLDALLRAGHHISLVVTQPDRPIGRKQLLTAPPVKLLALETGLPIEQPEKIRTNAPFRERIEALRPDAIVVVAYGRIIPPWMLQAPRLGCINLHGSLLPKYRGAAPIQWALANGDPVTGNTTMLLEEGLDTGPILLQQSLPILPEWTAVDLFRELAQRGAALVPETLDGLADGSLRPRPQDHSQATLAPILSREDGRMRFADLTAEQSWHRWRGFQPWPGAYAFLHGRKLIVNRLAPASLDEAAEPGVICILDGRLFVACRSQTWLELIEVQPEGKRTMAARDFVRGLHQAGPLRFDSTTAGGA